MKNRSNKTIRKLLTYVMLITTLFYNTGDTTVFASKKTNDRKIDIWDFGGVQEIGDLYNNNITVDTLNSKTNFKSGSFKTTSFGDLTIANPDINDRSYYYEADGITPGINSSSTREDMKNNYEDGYNSNGLYYANETSDNRKSFLTIDNVEAGDKVTVYGGTSKGDESIHFVHASVNLDGTDVIVKPDTTEVQDSSASFNESYQKVDFIAQYSGSYQIYVTSKSGGKSLFHRIERTPGVNISGTINWDDSGLSQDYKINFTNQTTGDESIVTVNSKNTFETVLPAGYDYIITFKDVMNHRFSDETKVISTSTSDISAGKNINLDAIDGQDTENDILFDHNTPSKTTNSTIWIVGDSTVSAFNDEYYYPRYGWGTKIEDYLDGTFDIQNIALSGRSSRSYTADTEYQKLLDGMKDGDFLLIGFGHNDEKQDPERYTNPNGTYLESGSFANSLYENYIKPAQDAGTKVILSTPIVRRPTSSKWSNSNLHVTETSGDYEGGDYSQSIRDLGRTLNIPVVDMTTLTKSLYDQLGVEGTLDLHAWTSHNPVTVDNTHTNIWGGTYNAYLVTKEIKNLGVSGLAEHIINSNPPTKEDTLISNPNYKVPIYDNNLTQSTLWKDHGIWKGTVFGSVGGTPNTSNQILETDSNGNMHIAVENNKGKISSTVDGIAMYYYKVPAESIFTLTAKAKINKFDSNDQVSFGLMARDDMYIDLDTNDPLGDYVAAAPLKLTNIESGGVWNSYARRNGSIIQGGTAENPIYEGDTIDLSITSNTDGYAVKLGNESTVTGGFDFKLTKVDPDYVYVGMFVARNADITFSDIKLVVDGTEITSEQKDDVANKDKETDKKDEVPSKEANEESVEGETVTTKQGNTNTTQLQELEQETSGKINDDQLYGDRLPNTASNLYRYLSLGVLLLITGGAIVIFRRKVF